MSRTDIDFKIGADMKQFRTAMGSIDHSLKKLSGGFGALGGVIGASFAVDIIQQFVSESVELASKMEGVEAAFNRLNDPNLLDNLRKATAGTVDDLKLMQTAVKAENFRIPMDVLAKGLDFAQRRAQATGESVDYMVDSFVTGLGRESVKILDNLGISTIELNAKTKELGSMAEAVGQIMDEEFKKVGERVTTTSMKVDQQRASITNLKTEIGEKLLPVYSAFLDNTNKGLGKINFILDDQEKGYKRLFVAVQSYFNITKFGLDLVTNPTKALLSLLGNTKEEVEELNTEFDKGLPSITAWADKFDAMQTQADEGAKKQKEAVEQYNNKLEKLLPTLQRVGYEIDRAFNPGEDTSGKLAHQLGFAEVNTELEELEDTVEEFGGAYKKTFDEMVEGFFNFEEATEEAADTFDHSFRNTIDKFREFRDEFLMVGDILRMSFEAAFAPLEEGETRLGNFREAFVQQLKMMAAQLLATAAAALILATILTVAFGGTNMAGQAMFGKAGMGFGDLFGGLLQGGGGFGFNGSGMTGNTSGGIEVFGKLLGSDILLSGRNRNRLSGIGG
jgi:predicted  nucleic acid-binding Zn-ribbon protein